MVDCWTRKGKAAGGDDKEQRRLSLFVKTAGKRKGIRLSAARYRSKFKQESQFKSQRIAGKSAVADYAECLWHYNRGCL